MGCRSVHLVLRSCHNASWRSPVSLAAPDHRAAGSCFPWRCSRSPCPRRRRCPCRNSHRPARIRILSCGFPPGPPPLSSRRRLLPDPEWPAILRQPGPAAAQAWQPAAIDENAPIAPPDGVPIAPGDGFPGPLPGIINAAGNCVITGEVSDATSLNPVAGAYVDVVGTGRTAETDAKGRFTIGGLPAGSFTLEATKLGYFTESSVITTLEGQPAEARFGLRLKPADDTAEETMLEEETIVGEYQGDSQGDFNLNLETSASVTSGHLQGGVHQNRRQRCRGRGGQNLRSQHCGWQVRRGPRLGGPLRHHPVQRSGHLIGGSIEKGRAARYFPDHRHPGHRGEQDLLAKSAR